MILCLLGLHRWVVDVPAHALAVLRSGRIVIDCARCGAWKVARTSLDSGTEE